MTTDQLYKIEKNKKFTNYICKRGIWKNYSFLPPSLVLFCGLFGLLYLFNQDQLISWNSIPFVAIFIIGTIWFKATRKYLIKKRHETITSLHICIALSLLDGKTNNLFIFTSKNNRSNISYLENKKKKIIDNVDLEKLNLTPHKPSILEKEDIFIVKTNKQINKNIYILLINDDEVRILKKKEIAKYKQ